MKTAAPTSIADQVEAQIDRSEWRTFKFSDLAENINEKISPQSSDLTHYIGLEHLDSGSLKIRRFGDPKTIKGDKLKIYKGDLIFAKRNAYLKRVSVAEFDAIASAHSMVLRAKPKTVLPEFLPFFMLSEIFWERAIAISVGSLSPTINWKALAKQEFVLPPKDQQARIAKLLKAADATIETSIIAERRCDVARRSFIANAFKEKAKDHDQLQDVAHVRYGLTLNSKRKELPTQLPYLRVANVGRETIDLTELKEVGVSESEIETYRLEPNDVLVVEGHANIQEIGRSAVWRDGADNVLHQNHLIRVRCTDRLNPRFLSAYINGPRGRGYFQGMAKSTSGLNTINSTVVKELKVPKVEESDQLRFVSDLDLHEQNQANAAELVQSAQGLLKSLINQIF
jgi:restriction endonuclease S subunit